jgi:hypothetical protein
MHADYFGLPDDTRIDSSPNESEDQVTGGEGHIS